MIVFFIQACNSGKDHIVEPSQQVPAFVMASIKEKYPTASDIKFSVLEEKKVYKANFRVNDREISVVSNNQKVLNTSTEAGEDFQDSLQVKLKGLAIAGGISSNYRIVEIPEQPKRYVTDYLLNGVNYTLSIDEAGYVLMNTSQPSYETKSLDDLPEKIRQFVSERNRPNPEYITNLPAIVGEDVKQYFLPKNELAYKKAAVYILPNGAKRYHVFMEYYGIDWHWAPLIFDENANLIWVPGYNQLEVFKSFLTMGIGPSTLSDDDMTYFKALFKAAQELNNFIFEKKLPNGDGYVFNTDASLNVYHGITNYQFQLYKLDSSREFWDLKYDKNKNMIDRIYHANPQ